jgi:transposase
MTLTGDYCVTRDKLALVATFHRHNFRNADAFVAFMGLDVRVRDSGKFRGRRRITNRYAIEVLAAPQH